MGRLAPTPSGHLHLGNVTAFAAAWLSVRSAGGRLLLRLEDLDQGRARTEVETSQRDDLVWLGLNWDEEVLRQSSRSYDAALPKLNTLTYRCTCSRALLQAARGRCSCDGAGHTTGALRLRLPHGSVTFTDRRWGPQAVALDGQPDPILVRADGVVGYTLAVVVDDLADGVTEVVRGADLLEATAAQIVLWQALGDRLPTWLHSPLILGADGRKLSKSHASLEVRSLRAAGWTPGHVWDLVLPWLGLSGCDLVDAVGRWSPTASPLGPLTCPLTSAEPPRPR